MSDDERELLLQAEKEALAVLSAANTEAGRIAREAEEDAVVLLREQQERASSLLQHAQEAAASDDTNATLESHRAAAELLAATEKEVAARLSTTLKGRAVGILMAGHRESAAILLAAWMRVTEERPTER